MAKDYEVLIDAHPNIYNGANRKLCIYFSEPENGVNDDTGLILFIPGFGGNAQSNVYKKMRRNFADQYNLVTIQCDYFGQEFMQEANELRAGFTYEDLSQIFTNKEMGKIYSKGSFQFDEFIKVSGNYNINLPVKAIINENLTNFNDMGVMQALDNVTAVMAVIAILKDNGLDFNAKKIIAYGHSHGAYLSYLCNAFSPGLFSLLIDNSAWISPVYLYQSRHLYKRYSKMTLDIEFDYYASHRPFDQDILSLDSLYENTENSCKVISFQGTKDNLVDSKKKALFCSKIDECDFRLVGPELVDGKVFKSTSHGLDADFLELFEFVIRDIDFSKSKTLEIENQTIITKENRYFFDFENGLVKLTVNKI